MISLRSSLQWQPIVSKTYVLALYQSTTCRIKTKKLDMDKKKILLVKVLITEFVSMFCGIILATWINVHVLLYSFMESNREFVHIIYYKHINIAYPHITHHSSTHHPSTNHLTTYHPSTNHPSTYYLSVHKCHFY